MKVVHVNAFDGGGGAARAAMRLHRGLLAQGVDSSLITVKPGTREAGVCSPLDKRQQLAAFVKRHAALRLAALQKTPSNPIIHSLGQFPSGLGRWINESDADVVNLHWVNAETLSIGEIARIKKPIVWTMHDMWPFMGAEHYDDFDCPGRWRTPYSASNRPPNHRGPDLDARTWARKARAWSGKTFHLVSPSRWLAGLAKESALMGNQPCSVIPNPLDTHVFAPVDQAVARRILGLPQDRKLILFGAIGATSDLRKGYDLLVSALQALEQNHPDTQAEVMVFGGPRAGEIATVGMKSHFLGEFHDDLSLRIVYSAADVFVAPSRQDNLPNTVVEAAACGLPTVAFDIGGMSDIITDGATGALAHPYDTAAMATKISRLLNSPVSREVVRDGAVAKFAPHTTIPEYQELYERIVGEVG
jgi:glycosyltransferase involved in cell wall biosynthesis